ncbi:MAG TPA: MFS transporter [Chloroflexia bacterium]|nr:MFS transporter [Chloroflexia bacterium]
MKAYNNIISLERAVIQKTDIKIVPAISSVRTALAVLALSGILISAQMYVTIPVAGQLGQQFGLSRDTVSWLTSLYSLGYAVGFLFSGPLSDRFGRKAVILPGMLAMALITLTIGLSPNFEIMLVLRLIQGLIAAAFAPAAVAYITEMFPAHLRQTGTAVMGTSFLLAGIVGQLYAGPAAQAFGWRGMFWLMMVLYGLAALALWLGLPGDHFERKGSSLGRAFISMGNLLRQPALLAIFAADLTVILSFVGLYSALGAHFNSDNLFLIRLAGTPGIFASLLGLSLYRRWGARRVTIGGFTLAATGIALVASADQILFVALAGIIFTAGISLTIAGLIATVGSLANQARGAAFALHSFMLFAGGSLGPLMVTLLLPAGFSVFGLSLAALLLASALAIKFGVRRQ